MNFFAMLKSDPERTLNNMIDLIKKDYNLNVSLFNEAVFTFKAYALGLSAENGSVQNENTELKGNPEEILKTMMRLLKKDYKLNESSFDNAVLDFKTYAIGLSMNKEPPIEAKPQRECR